MMLREFFSWRVIVQKNSHQCAHAGSTRQQPRAPSNLCSRDVCPSACDSVLPPPPPPPFEDFVPPADGGGGDSPCFAKESTTVCRFTSPEAECQDELMANLAVGDYVLGRDGATRVIAVQHKANDIVSEMLTFHTDGRAVSMTADHGVFVDGKLVAAGDAKVGSALSAGTIQRITKSKARIINAVTDDGTVVADGVLAASNPAWLAALTIDAPWTRAVANALVLAAGDVDSIGEGAVAVLGARKGGRRPRRRGVNGQGGQVSAPPPPTQGQGAKHQDELTDAAIVHCCRRPVPTRPSIHERRGLRPIVLTTAILTCDYGHSLTPLYPQSKADPGLDPGTRGRVAVFGLCIRGVRGVVRLECVQKVYRRCMYRRNHALGAAGAG